MRGSFANKAVPESSLPRIGKRAVDESPQTPPPTKKKIRKTSSTSKMLLVSHFLYHISNFYETHMCWWTLSLLEK